MPPNILIEYDHADIEKTENEQLFINIIICLIWTFYLYEVYSFFKEIMNRY